MEPQQNDRWTIRMIALGILVLGAVALLGAIWLAHDGKPVPDLLQIVAGASIPTSAALLANTRAQPGVKP